MRTSHIVMLVIGAIVITIIIAGAYVLVHVYPEYEKETAATAEAVTPSSEATHCSQYTTYSSCIAAGCRWDSTYDACFPP